VTEAVATSTTAALGIDAAAITVVPRGRSRTRLGEPGGARRAAARAMLGLDVDDEVVLSVGRQEWQKNQELLLDALAAIVARRPSAVLVIAGRRGSSSAAIDRRVDEIGSLGAHVRLLGHRDDVPELLAAADVFALPSRYEGTAGAMIEAMAMSVPIVASDLSGLAEVIGDSGAALLVPPRSAAFADLLEDGERRATIAAAGRAEFERRFTLDASATAMAALFREVAEQTSDRRRR
jgi:glycosyltransferase involved in cell wall biosynthesis